MSKVYRMSSRLGDLRYLCIVLELRGIRFGLDRYLTTWIYISNLFSLFDEFIFFFPLKKNPPSTNFPED